MQSLIEFPLSESDQEDMAQLRKEHQDFIRTEITRQLSAAIDEFRPHGWAKVTHFVREWGIAGTIIAVFVALLALAAGAFYQATTRVGKEATFEANTERDIGEIKKDIQAIRGDLAKQSLTTHAALPLADFKTTLPEVRSAIAVARQSDVKVAPKVIEDLQQKLTASGERSPGFWPAAAEFISYRSYGTTSGTLFTNLPNCTDRDPAPSKVGTKSPDGSVFTVENPVYENCRITLDSTKDTDKLNELLEHKDFAIVFRNCLVVYHGGEIHLTVHPGKRDAVIHGDNGPVMATVATPFTLGFTNCLFDFGLNSPPPPLGQQLTHSILATSSPTITFTVSESRKTPSA
jgi:hypothetical protein